MDMNNIEEIMYDFSGAPEEKFKSMKEYLLENLEDYLDCMKNELLQIIEKEAE